VMTVQLFLLQILHDHTACRHLPHLAGFYFSASAYCQARAKLPVRLLEYLLERLGQSVQSCDAQLFLPTASSCRSTPWSHPASTLTPGPDAPRARADETVKIQGDDVRDEDANHAMTGT
jgi:hypothetical protein